MIFQYDLLLANMYHLAAYFIYLQKLFAVFYSTCFEILPSLVKPIVHFHILKIPSKIILGAYLSLQ